MRLPLHAAGIYTGNNQVCCSDYFVASYTPSVGALLHAQQSFRPVRRSSETETLVVAVEQPCQGAALPEAIKEATVVREHVSPSKTFQVSTTDGVLEHLQTASILHLACHGTQNLSDALQSGFHLEDGMLTISKLTELELPRAFLAVLSACETARGDVAQPDQAIHLAGAMLFAGFKSVVATMWYVLLLLHVRRILTPSATAGPCETRRGPWLPKASTPNSSRQVTYPRT
jgi:CHAT domain-containing protein